MTLDEFATHLAAIIGRPSFLRPFVCEGSPLACDILLVGFNPRTPMPADYWSFWREGYGFEKKTFEQAYEVSQLADGQSHASNTREVMRRFAKGASDCNIVEANLYAKNSKDERALAKSDRDLRPFRFILGVIHPRVVVPFGRFAKREFAGMQVNCPVEPVKHFSRGWSYDAAEAFGAKLAVIAKSERTL